MSESKNFLAVFLGNPNQPMMTEWNAMPEAKRQQLMKEGGNAWHAWTEKYKNNIVFMGSPLGKTKVASKQGIGDVSNALCAYTVVSAASHDEAVRMFENHPHFAIFPGESVEVMECLPIPPAM
ncbi:MAG TPA: hypothetical protein VHL14_05525 [Steroidobacteraceae bacterium]|nr:hypothetical protein [Steroidobacteraceae bacterium]